MSKSYSLSEPQQGFFTYYRIIIIIGVLFTLLSAIIIWSASKAYYNYQSSQTFESNVQINIDNIDKRMSMYENSLRSGLAFFIGSGNVSREEWTEFVNTLKIKAKYPGMQGIGFAKMLSSDEVMQIEQEMRKEGFAEFTFKPKGKREQYSSILFLEPMDKRNLQAIGYDMFSETKRHEAMENARDTGLTSISEKITLVQEIDSDIQAGMLMYLPMYKKGAKIDTIEERRESLLGFIYSAFRMNDLMSKISLEKSHLNIKIYDHENMSENNLLYKSFKDSSYMSEYNTVKTLTVNNRTWYISFSSTKEFDDSVEKLYPLLITLMGLLVNLFLLFIILSLIKSRQKIQIQAKINEEQATHMLNQARLAQMGEMLSMIAHQWRQPLSSIGMMGNNMILDVEFNKLNEQRSLEYANSIIEQTQYLSKTIDDFRNFYKPNKEVDYILLREPVNSALNLIRTSLKYDNIKIIEAHNEDDKKAKIYYNELVQVILNILKNAQDNFKEKDIKNPYIKITTHDKTITICDNGGGIPEDIIDKIFDPYFSTKNEKNGTGLGLHMSKTIVEKHHSGNLIVKNRDDGVCFTIELDMDNIVEI